MFGLRDATAMLDLAIDLVACGLFLYWLWKNRHNNQIIKKPLFAIGFAMLLCTWYSFYTAYSTFAPASGQTVGHITITGIALRAAIASLYATLIWKPEACVVPAAQHLDKEQLQEVVKSAAKPPPLRLYEQPAAVACQR